MEVLCAQLKISGSETEHFQVASDGKYEHLQGEESTPSIQNVGTFFFLPRQLVNQPGLESNQFHTSTGLIFFQALIISPASCIFTVNTALDSRHRIYG